MKSLLIKDMRILLRQKTTFLIIVLLGVFLGTNGGNISFSMGYMMMVSATLAITTISYDYFEKGMSFLLTLPITKKMYVVEKYLLSAMVGLVVALLGCFLNVLGGLFGAQAAWNEFAATAGVSLAAAMIMLAIYIPVYLKCGPEKSRVAILIVVGVFVGGGYLAIKVEPVQKLLYQLLEKLSIMELPQVIGIGVAVWALLMAVSIVISLGIMEKKEF